MNVFALSFAVMLVLVLLELLALHYWRKTPIPWREIIFNLNSGHIVMWMLRGVEVAAYALLLQYANLHLTDQLPQAGQWAFAFIAWDLSFYCMHRAHHCWAWLWAIHVVHHQGEHFSLSLGARNSWYSSLTSLLFTAPLALLGVSVEMFVAVSSFHYAVQLYNHNALVGRSGWLDRVLVTPSNHRVHHAVHPIYINKNFGGTLLLWDKLFGSYQAERDDVALEYGVAGHHAPCLNPAWASNPWLQKLTRCGSAYSRGFGDKKIPDSCIATAGVLLFLMVIYFVDAMVGMALSQKLGFFTCLVVGTIFIAGMSEDKRWGWLGWIVLTFVTPLLCGRGLEMRPFAAWTLFALLFGHGLWTLQVKERV